MLCPYVQGTQIGLLSPLTGHGSLCLHTEIHVLVPVTADCECLADIAAARHAHWYLRNAAGTRRRRRSRAL